MDNRGPRLDSPFHTGERLVQERLGIAERMRGIGQRAIRTWMPEQHQRFYEQLPFMLAGSVDSEGRPWSSVLVGQPGFVRAPDAQRLEFNAKPVEGDPLAQALRPDARLGFLGIELHTRRRNRVNGRVAQVGTQGFTLAVEQTTGNCPQYIQGREFAWVRDAKDLRPRGIDTLAALDDAARATIAQADTLFVATAVPLKDGDGDRGADVSHRGGRAGFVKIEDEHTLLVPDYAGNHFFMTLGNLQLNPRAGVLFIDFDSGDLLTLTGRAEVVWDGAPELQAFEGAERAWRFHIESGLRLRDALPLRWKFRDWSPNSLITGTWEEAERKRQAQQLAQSWRPYRIDRVAQESVGIRSFHLEPADDLPVPPIQAGQHLPIRLRLSGGETLHRTYTISQAPGDAGLRLSVKRDGLASGHLHDTLKAGDQIEALGPRGQFTIDAQERRPAVLIGAGVGITPMIAFARHLVAEGFRHRRTRPAHLIQVAHDAASRAFAEELKALQREAQGALQVHTVLSLTGDDASVLPGPFNVELLKRLLPFDDHEFFLCGPTTFMQSVYDGLRELGVRDERIQAESFGPSSLKRRPDGAQAEAPPPEPVAEHATVVFRQSGEAADWTPVRGTLLEFAESKGLSPPYSCREGHCGSCATPLLAGRVTYAQPTAWKPAQDEVLLCCARPAQGGGELVELAL